MSDAPLTRTDHHVHSTWSDDTASTTWGNLVAARAAGLSAVRMVDSVDGSTTWVPEGWQAARDVAGNMLMRRDG